MNSREFCGSCEGYVAENTVPVRSYTGMVPTSHNIQIGGADYGLVRYPYARPTSPAGYIIPAADSGQRMPHSDQVRGQHSTVPIGLRSLLRGFLIRFGAPDGAHELIAIEQVQLGHSAESTAVGQ